MQSLLYVILLGFYSQGLFVKHIQQETNTKVQIKGIGSGFIDPETGLEAPEPMHIAIV